MLTKETIKGMKKKELIELAIANQNRLEYMIDKIKARDLEIVKFKAGLEELQKSTEILLMKVTKEKGAEVNGGKELWLPRKTDLDGYEVQTKLDEAGERIGIILTKKE